MGGWSGRFPWAAQRGLLGAFPSIFSFSRRPPGHAVRFRGRRSAIFLLFSVGPLHLVVFSLGWTRFLNLWRTGPRLPSRPPFPLMAGVGPVPAAACAVPCCEGIAAGQRACACVRSAGARVIPILRLVRCLLVYSQMPLVGAPAVCLHASVISVGPAFSCVAFFLVFPGLLSSVCVCVCSHIGSSFGLEPTVKQVYSI